jgi:hypothetical protein
MRSHILLMKNRLTRWYPFRCLAEGLTGVQVPVKARKVARADLDPDSMARKKDVAGSP